MSLMAENSRSGVSHDFHMASRKAEEAALRRYQAVHWLECVVGPLGIHSEPAEREFISCLRNGIILCNVINKIQPGTISKVVDNNVPEESVSVVWDSKPLPAYQYFENVRNFLVAVEELKLPGFEASDLERENFEAGSAARIADCILALKSYHEWKEWSGGKGVYKHVTVKSPLVLHSAAKNFARPSKSEAAQPCRRLDMSAVDHEQSLADSIVKALTDLMVDSKENMNGNYLKTTQNENQDPVQVFSELLSRCLEEKLRNKFPTLNLQETSGQIGGSHAQLTSVLKETIPININSKSNKPQRSKGNKDRWLLLQSQEKDLRVIKALWSDTKKDFEGLQGQLMSDLICLENLVKEMSAPALGYQKVVQENRKLYNMVQDLKGNIRVYCRIKPLLNEKAKNVVSFQGEDGTLMIVDPSKPDGKKNFQFNRVYGPVATQGDLFKDAQPLIRSVLDGYNVCILAYGQTGSGKSQTMYGPSGASEKEMGINFFALNDIFQTLNLRKDIISYELHVQMVEIFNEQIQDLLCEISEFQDGESLPDVTSHAIVCSSDAIALVKKGEMRRRETMNLNSFSHSVVTIHVQGKDLSGNILRSRLHLAYLAGSGEDDKSLSCLEDVITSLSQKNSDIHYRNSKLTSHLQDALGGKAKILVFAHVIPEEENFTKTFSTLKFSQRISTIELGAAQSNKMNSEVMELKNEIESLKAALGGDMVASSPQPNKQLKSPCDKAKGVLQRTPVRSRRLSMENPASMKTDKLPKSPMRRSATRAISPCALRTDASNPSARKTSEKPLLDGSLPRSRRLSIENSIIARTDGVIRVKEPKSPCEGKKGAADGSLPRSRRLSIENSIIARTDRVIRVKEPKSPCEGKKGAAKRTPPRTRRLRIENPSLVKPDIDIRKSTKTPQSSLRVRRLSLEGPKDRTKDHLKTANVAVVSNAYTSMMDVPKSPTPSYQNGPTFTDCAAKYPSIQPPTTPEPPSRKQQVTQSGVKILTDSQTPGIAKSANGKGSQFKKSLRSIGKLINGSEKRNQHKLESTSTKGKDNSDGSKLPQSSKAKVLRRQSLTSLPPPGTNRRSSLGGNDNRNVETPPSSVHSSTTSAKRWM